MNYRVKILEHISDVNVASWNNLGISSYPFLRHEFLNLLETEGCLGKKFGWLSRHIAVFDESEQLIAASPMYLKFNSYGEFVFDWAWADAYQRNGLSYYPKLVSASPYTPATGPKLLLAENTDPECRQILINAALELAKHSQCSSLHWLFPSEKETQYLVKQDFNHRIGCQFHWENKTYNSFDHYLEGFTSSKRKNIKRERRRVTEAGISFNQLNGHTANTSDWEDFHLLYESTFDKFGGMATLSQGFFTKLAAAMPESVLLVQAIHEGEIVAAAFCLVGEKTLYGRHWGCREEFDNLHFETCYYQGLEYCIEHGLDHFEPGAQGEHKISRGFLPKKTWSAHWIADEQFKVAINNFLNHEEGGMLQYIDDLTKKSPFKNEVD